MKIRVQFFSYFQNLTGCDSAEVELAESSTIGDLVKLLRDRHPRLIEMERSTLIAVGLEYQKHDHVLHDDDEVSLFPPVQGG
jgi:MoaD family protein